MRHIVRLSFDEQGELGLLNWLARENARIHRARPDLPLLYESGVGYRSEGEEVFSDYLHVLLQGGDDCDSLAAARAGELLARGARALHPGEGGYDRARAEGALTLKAQVYLRTRSHPERPGLYHCVVRYQVGGVWYVDDPSERLGMSGRVDPTVKARWRGGAGWPPGRST